MRVHSSVKEEIEEKGFAFFPVSVEFFWWVASQFSCECGGSCRDSASAPSSSTSTSATASAKRDGVNGETGSCGCCCGGLRLGTCHDVRREGLWGGNISLVVSVEYVVPFLVCKAFVDCCSFDVIWEIVFYTSVDEL